MRGHADQLGVAERDGHRSALGSARWPVTAPSTWFAATGATTMPCCASRCRPTPHAHAFNGGTPKVNGQEPAATAGRKLDEAASAARTRRRRISPPSRQRSRERDGHVLQHDRRSVIKIASTHSRCRRSRRRGPAPFRASPRIRSASRRRFDIDVSLVRWRTHRLAIGQQAMQQHRRVGASKTAASCGRRSGEYPDFTGATTTSTGPARPPTAQSPYQQLVTTAPINIPPVDDFERDEGSRRASSSGPIDRGDRMANSTGRRNSEARLHPPPTRAMSWIEGHFGPRNTAQAAHGFVKHARPERVRGPPARPGDPELFRDGVRLRPLLR